MFGWEMVAQIIKPQEVELEDAGSDQERTSEGQLGLGDKVREVRQRWSGHLVV